MGGGLMQLVAYGAQDIYLTGNPQITFFKVVYRRHTNFAIESIDQTYNGSVGAGKKLTVTIARNGDLLHRIWLEMTCTDVDSAFKHISFAEIEIGGQVIDKQYGEWMAIWTNLTHNYDQAKMLDSMVDGTSVFVPLQFWFCRNPGLALPLIALQYHEVKLNIQFATSTGGNNWGAVTDLTVWCDYIFLDTDERRRFAQVSHEYLIEQVQFSNDLKSAAGSNQIELRFNHPVKELVWVVESDASFAGINGTTVDNAVIQLNGQDRFKRRVGAYFTKVQRYQHHSGAGDQLDGGAVHVYSFGLKPEEHQPSGTCNFSRIDNAIINYNQTGSSNTFRMWAVNYNVLRIMSGMGGLAYSN